jgi:glycine cleavage system H protein
MKMKEISELKFPDNVRYTDDHEWATLDGDIATIGISDYAQDQLGDIVFVELPETGGSFDKSDEFGTVESVKAVSELYMPLGGEVVGINPNLEESSEQVNSDPYGGGWMLKIKVADPAEFDALMDKEAYLESLKG